MAGQDLLFDTSRMGRKVAVWEVSHPKNLYSRIGPLFSCGQQVKWPSGKLAASSGNG